MYKNKKVLVTGSSGLIGTELVKLLKNLGANVIEADIRNDSLFDNFDLTDYDTCLALCNEADYVFHLVGVKGSPQMTKTRPVDFMAPMLMCDTNMIIAAQQNRVKRFLYTSSIALLNLHTDHFPGTAKQTAETLIDAMKIQYPNGTKYCVVRPASVYGPHENWDRDGLMFVSKMIKESVINKNDIELWNDGQSVRDIIHARDVAQDMIEIMKEMPDEWVGIGGSNETILDISKEISNCANVNLTIDNSNKETDSRTIQRKWNPDRKRISLKQGIMEVIKHVKSNCSNTN